MKIVESEDDKYSSEFLSDRIHFNLLSWLVLAKPDCSIAISALKPIIIKHPEWRQSDHPDFHYWVGSVKNHAPQSPWSIEQLLAMDLNTNLDECFDRIAVPENVWFTGHRERLADNLATIDPLGMNCAGIYSKHEHLLRGPVFLFKSSKFFTELELIVHALIPFDCELILTHV